MSNTISKNFKDSEIKGVMYIEGKKVLYLKEGVKRRFYKNDLPRWAMENPSHINHLLVFFKKYEDTIKMLYGGDDFSTEE